MNGAKLGIVGFCMGGRLVYLMSATSKELKAGVMFYGGGTMLPFGQGPSPFDRTQEISCPVQGHFGADDKDPSPEDMRKLDAELTKFGKTHEFHTYQGVAHAFVNSGSDNYRPHAASLSWPKAMEFFSRHLRGEGASIQIALTARHGPLLSPTTYEIQAGVMNPFISGDRGTPATLAWAIINRS
jgi:dienelactone hydrolase